MRSTILFIIAMATIVGIFLGLIVYSYTQIHISLDGISFGGFDWNLSHLSVLSLGINLLTENILGSVLSVITGIKLNLLFTLSNNGIFPVYIPNLSYEVSINGFKMGQGHSNIDVVINPGDAKQLPILQDLQLSSLAPITSSVIASNGVMDVKVHGTAFYKFLGLSIPVPFESLKKVSVTDEVKKYLANKLLDQSPDSYSTPSLHGG